MFTAILQFVTFSKLGLIALTVALYTSLSGFLWMLNPYMQSAAAPAQAAIDNIPKPDVAGLTTSIKEYDQALAIAKAKDEVQTNYQNTVNRVRNYLRQTGSPMANYAHVIISAANRCGGNYRSLLAIAKIESGFGKYPYKKYNPYGYLNGRQYSGWAEALDKLSCQISQQYLSKYGTDFVAMGKIYAGSSTTWASKVRGAYNQIP